MNRPPSSPPPELPGRGEEEGRGGRILPQGSAGAKKPGACRKGLEHRGCGSLGLAAPEDRAGGQGRGGAPHGPARFPPREDLHFPRPQALLARCFSPHFAGSGDPGPLLGPLVSR